MRKSVRAILVVVLALLSSVVLGVAAMLTSAFSLAASTVLIMGDTGDPDPDKVEGHVPNVLSYYIYPNTFCTGPSCKTEVVVTPETAWPLYGGLSALTWRDSINVGVDLLDIEVQKQLAKLGPNDHLVIFGYSQSAVIASIEKQRLADQLTDEEEQQVEWVLTGNPSRPNGGINGRLPFTIPIVEFPYGPVTPTDTKMSTDDIALKWDIIADAPLVVTNPIAMLNAFIGGPGFGINHGTYPNPQGTPPTGLVGGYTQEEWQAIMDNPEGYAATNPDVVNVQQFGDTRYITVAPRVLPLVVPLHMVGLGFVADLMEPALRDIIEQTGYDRSIPYGQPTTFRLIPIFNPITLTIDLIADIPEGIQQAMNGGPPPLNPPAPLTTSTMTTLSASGDSPTTVDMSKDSTTDPEAGSTTLRGAATTPLKTEVENASGTNAMQSNTPEVKQVDPAKEDVTKDSEEIKKVPEGTKEDRKGPKKNQSGVSVSLNFSPKKPADNDKGGATPGQDEASDTASPEGTESEQAAA